MSNEWKVVPGHYPGFLNIVGASFNVSIVTSASDLTVDDYVNRTNDAHIMSAAKDLLAVVEEMFIIGDRLVSDTYGYEFTKKARAATEKARGIA